MKKTTLLGPLLAGLLAFGLAVPLAWAEEKPISAAEQRVFLDDHLANVGKAATLEYSFKRTGTLEPAFDDQVLMTVRDGTPGAGRVVTVAFLTGARNLSLPEVPNAEANPVVLYFLERDVRQMERLTSGKRNFFQRRVRLALAEAPEVRPIKIRFEGRELKADEITVRPYVNDPLKSRFEKFEHKTYTFILSDQVPGGVYQLRTTVAGAKGGDGAPLMDELMTFTKVRP